MRTEGQPQLFRTLGPWDLTAISLNTIIGSGIRLLPATAAALISTAGYVLGASLVVPRVTFALAEQGQFPAVFARVHARCHSPWVAIAVHGIVTWILAAGFIRFCAEVAEPSAHRLTSHAASTPSGRTAEPPLRRRPALAQAADTARGGRHG